MSNDSLGKAGKRNARKSSILVAVVLAAMMFIPTGLAWGGKDVTHPAPLSQPVGPVMEGTPSGGPGVQTVVIQPNVTVGKDTHIDDSNPDANNGNNDVIPVGSISPTHANGLVQFDLPTVTASLHAATLSLYCNLVMDPLHNTNVSVFAANSSWVELQANWSYRATGTLWNVPGGDRNTSYYSYINVSQVNSWYSWNVTSIVNQWRTGSLANNGFILNGTPLDVVSNYVQFRSSDFADLNYSPKLTLIYDVEMKAPLPSQTMQEDEATRNIALNGMGNGTVEKISGPYDGSTAIPFFGNSVNQAHIQYIYLPNQVGSEGVIRRIGYYARSTTPANSYGNFSNYVISMAHTSLTQFSTPTSTYATNYNGSLIEVFRAANFVVNSSNAERWVYFDLTDNFTYDSHYNLLIDIVWSGDNGIDVYTDLSDAVSQRTLDWAGGATGSTGDNIPVTKFAVDVVDNAMVDNNQGGNNWLFPLSPGYMRYQMLYNATELGNQAGLIDKIGLQKYASTNAAFPNLTISIGYTTKGPNNMTDTFAWNTNNVTHTTVFTAVNYTFRNDAGWFDFDITNWQYDGTRNILVDIQWNGTPWGSSVNLYRDNSGIGVNQTYTPTPGSLTGTTDSRCYNLRLMFADSANLTWSAASQNATLFTAGTNGANGRNLWITPVANAFGAGTLQLTLTNTVSGVSVTQNVAVTITAVNDAPVLTGVPPTLACTEDIDAVLNMSAYASDIDNTPAQLHFTTNSTHATVNGSLIAFNYGEGQNGESVLITVSDGSLSDTTVVVTTVTFVNDQPYFTSVVANLTCDATVRTQYIVTTGDEETPLNVSITTSSPYATVDNHLVWFTYPKGVGAESVNITIWDITTYGVVKSASKTLLVTVIDHPDVTANTPTGTGIAVTTTITATFDVAMDTAATASAFQLSLGGVPVSGNATWSADNKTMTFAPASHLTNGEYNATISTGARDANGMAMLAQYKWNFTAALGTFDGDGDTIPDQYEMDHGLDPNANDAGSDLDSDGMPNLYEYQHSLNPQTNDAGADADGDGSTNLQEYTAGTDPQDATSKPSIFGGIGDFMWIILIIVIVAIAAVIAVVFMMMKKKGKPAQAPQQPSGDQPPQEQQAPPQDVPAQEVPPAPQDGQPPQQQQ